MLQWTTAPVHPWATAAPAPTPANAAGIVTPNLAATVHAARATAAAPGTPPKNNAAPWMAATVFPLGHSVLSAPTKGSAKAETARLCPAVQVPAAQVQTVVVAMVMTHKSNAAPWMDVIVTRMVRSVRAVNTLGNVAQTVALHF